MGLYVTPFTNANRILNGCWPTKSTFDNCFVQRKLSENTVHYEPKSKQCNGTGIDIKGLC